jgi:hypothetical protein
LSDDELIARARERANASPVPDDWGYRVVLDQSEAFVGRWRGETVDELNNGRRVFLLLDGDGERCFSRYYAALGREIDRVKPEIGCRIVIVRSEDYVSQGNTGYSFGVATNDAPLPGDDIPF